MTNVFIIHGTYGSPNENWFPWLRTKLEELGCNVFVPQFPTPKGQNFESWKNTLSEYEDYINEDTIFVGHSLGPSFILSVIQDLKHRVRAAYFVAGFIGLLGNEFDKLNEDISVKDFDWIKIRKNCHKFYVFNSDDDPYVPLSKGVELSKKLRCDLFEVKNAKHFNAEAGFTRLDFLLDKIKEEL